MKIEPKNFKQFFSFMDSSAKSANRGKNGIKPLKEINEDKIISNALLEKLEENEILATKSVVMGYINALKNNSDLNDIYKKNLKKILQKIGSSNKTKVIHKLIINDKCQMGYGAVKLINLKTVPGNAALTDNTLNYLAVDLNFICDEFNRTELKNLINKSIEQQKEREKNLTVLDELSEYRVQKLDLEIKITSKQILDSIDYYKAVDAYYYLFLQVLIELAIKSNTGKNKIFLLCKDLFDLIIQRALDGFMINEERFEEIQIIVALVYSKVYLKLSDNNIKKNLVKSFGAEKMENFLNPENHTKIKIHDIKSIYDIANLLTIKEIKDISSNVLRQRIKLVAGDKIEEILELSFTDFAAYMVSIKYPNTLFGENTIDIDRQTRLENLILNFKSSLKY